MTKIAVFASGRGSNFRAIQDGIDAGQVSAQVCVLICDSEKAGAITFAKERNIATEVISPKDFANPKSFGEKLLSVLQHHRVQWIVLAGYLKKIPQDVISSFRQRIVNIHPSLLPAFGGPGMYGSRVHQAVFDRGVKISGVTIHLVNEVYDDGPIVAQIAVDVTDCPSPRDIAARILQIEHELYPKTLEKLLTCEFAVKGKRVKFGK